ncbi:Myb-like_DNA-binding domain-containing protein [Hexamita inflata]|uniref:Myb-like DNA-binding domain-containing protein n=1 Tax=Hexamita inflata TaxID=28002 RepID=A0AA86VKH7_9EUKA|nr:Myb-like DNA-binding domain-containing protein [Hexamita inflata]
MKKVSWTKPEIDHLTQLTAHSRKFEKKIDWNIVAAQIPSRTASQCKSYYANVLKKTLDVPIRQNHKWNRDEIIALWVLCSNFNKDYSFIQKNYIPNLSVKQIASQFGQIQKQQQAIYYTFKKILKKPDYIQNISETEFRQQLQILQAIPPRQEQLVEMQQQIQYNQLFKTNNFEQNAVKAFFLDINPQIIQDQYSLEAIRRSISSNQEYIM